MKLSSRVTCVQFNRVCAVSGVTGLPNAKTRTDRGEGERHDGDVLRTGQGQPPAGRHLQAQEHLPKSRRGGLRCGASASQADQGAAKNVNRLIAAENSSC